MLKDVTDTQIMEEIDKFYDSKRKQLEIDVEKDA